MNAADARIKHSSRIDWQTRTQTGTERAHDRAKARQGGVESFSFPTRRARVRTNSRAPRRKCRSRVGADPLSYPRPTPCDGGASARAGRRITRLRLRGLGDSKRANGGNGRANEVTRDKIAFASAQGPAKRGEVHLRRGRRTRVEFREALREKARRGVRGLHHQELVERGGDLNEPLEKLTLRLVLGDPPALLPSLVRFEEAPRIEEARAAFERIVHGRRIDEVPLSTRSVRRSRAEWGRASSSGCARARATSRPGARSRGTESAKAGDECS